MGMKEKMMRNYIRGCNDTWEMIENAISNVKGIGPKRQAEMIEAIRKMVAEEMDRSVLTPSEQKKVNKYVDELGRG